MPVFSPDSTPARSTAAAAHPPPSKRAAQLGSQRTASPGRAWKSSSAVLAAGFPRVGLGVVWCRRGRRPRWPRPRPGYRCRSAVDRSRTTAPRSRRRGSRHLQRARTTGWQAPRPGWVDGRSPPPEAGPELVVLCQAGTDDPHRDPDAVQGALAENARAAGADPAGQPERARPPRRDAPPFHPPCLPRDLLPRAGRCAVAPADPAAAGRLARARSWSTAGPCMPAQASIPGGSKRRSHGRPRQQTGRADG